MNGLQIGPSRSQNGGGANHPSHPSKPRGRPGVTSLKCTRGRTATPAINHVIPRHEAAISEFGPEFLNGRQRSVNRKVQGSNPWSGAKSEFISAVALDAHPRRTSFVHSLYILSTGHWCPNHHRNPCPGTSLIADWTDWPVGPNCPAKADVHKRIEQSRHTRPISCGSSWFESFPLRDGRFRTA